MEAVADAELWIWARHIRKPGSLENINILNASSIMGNILNGTLHYFRSLFIAWMARSTSTSISRSMAFTSPPPPPPPLPLYICGHYIGGGSRKERSFASAQGAMCKDLETAPGVLVSRWALQGKPCMLMERSFAAKVMQARIILILHIIVVGARRDGYHSELFRLAERAVNAGFLFRCSGERQRVRMENTVMSPWKRGEDVAIR